VRLLHRSTRSRPRGGRRAVVAIATIAVGAAALYVGALRGLSPVESAIHVPWWALAVPFLLAEAYPLHLQFQSETTTLTLSEVGLVLGFFAASPGEMLLAQLCGALIALVAIRRQRPLKVAFNLAQLGLSSCIALVVFRTVAGLGETHGPAGGLGALAGAAAFSVATVMLVTAMIAIAAGHSVRRELPHVSLLALIGSLATASLVVAAVELVTNDAWAAWLLLLPAASCALAFRAYGTQRRRHEHLEFLYQSMRATQGAPEFRAALRELAIAARAMLCANFAEIVLTSPANDGALRCVIRPDGAEVMETSVLTDSDLLALGHASAHDHAVLLPRGRAPHMLDPYLGERDIGDGMLAALRRDDRIFGMLLVGDRAGDVSTFNEDDRKLIETFASHAGVLLENDRVKEQLRYQAFHDALTGLPNRTLFAERVGDALERHSRATGSSATVLFLDLDDFKTINDSLGHSAGDELLAAVAERVRACVRPGDTAARLGGDEFGILLERASADEAVRMAARVVEALRAPFVLHGREMAVHTSIGIATGHSGESTADALLANADVAMYSAKASGKRQYAVYEPDMHTRVRRRHELAGALERAIENSEITVQYQPIVTLASEHTVAFEALVRWQHPSRGLVLPGSFVPLAEEMGLMVAIGRSVLREACGRASEWRRQAPDGCQVAVAVNLSATELRSSHLVHDVESILADCRLAPEQLILEITESGAMRDPDATLETLRALGRLGVRLALDDFGTGYSSLSHLRDFPIDILKIAKPFVDRLGAGAYDATFADAILRLAGALDLDVVAEGIERREQAEMLRRLNCGLGQGYYFARPVDAAGAAAYLTTSATAFSGRGRIRAA
jgi:diguanylate cyclase (GGDEF)-like protein